VKYRPKAYEVEAEQWSGKREDADPIIHWVNSTKNWTATWRDYRPYSSGGLFPQEAQERVDEGIYIKYRTSWDWQYLGPGDYITFVDGVFQIRKRAAFESDYEPVGAP
jgi:hypothetical protein